MPQNRRAYALSAAVLSALAFSPSAGARESDEDIRGARRTTLELYARIALPAAVETEETAWANPYAEPEHRPVTAVGRNTLIPSIFSGCADKGRVRAGSASFVFRKPDPDPMSDSAAGTATVDLTMPGCAVRGFAFMSFKILNLTDTASPMKPRLTIAGYSVRPKPSPAS